MDVIFIHGAPASGKYTIGVKLSELTGLPLFHNHLAVDTAKSLFPFGTPAFIRMRAIIWQAAFDEAAKAGQSFIFTFNPESTVDPALITTMCASVQFHGGRVRFVQLVCSRETILNRLGNPGRTGFGKLTDREPFSALEAQGAFDFPTLPPPHVVVDTDNHDADAAARIIAQAIGLVSPSAQP